MYLTSTSRWIIMVIGCFGWILLGIAAVAALSIATFLLVDWIVEDLGWWAAAAFMAFLFMLPFMVASIEMSITHSAQEQIRWQNRDL